MTSPTKVVAVTGACGYIGTRLLMQLETNPNIGEIVAFDQKPLPYPIHNISFYQRGLVPPKPLVKPGTKKQDEDETIEWDESKSIAPLLRKHGVHTLVHLACAYSHADVYQDWAEESKDNLVLLDWVQRSCAAAGVNHVIFLSSHRVYGTYADNPVPIGETAELRARTGDSLGHASFSADLLMQDFKNEQDAIKDGPSTKVTILRACPVLGYSDDHFRAEHVFPYHFLGAGENPPFQFLHEVDLALLLEKVIQREQDGIFNVAGEGVVFMTELADTTRRKLTQLPALLAHPAAWMSARLGKSGLGNWNLNTSRYPIIMSTGNFKQTLDFRFGYTSMEALNAFVNYNGL